MASRIVVVNDDATQLGILAGILEKSGFAVQGYAEAEQALQAMHGQTPPDLIITDLYMPGIDGWRFCRLLRSPEFKDLNGVPIIVVSATFSGDEAALVTSELGAAGFLSSPVQPDQFIAQVRQVLQGNTIATLPRVLIVDDSKSLANALRDVFESHAYTADVALNGQEALEAFKADHYDLVVLDYHLPDIMGNVLLESFREQRPETVCVMITTDTQPKLALEWMRKGAAAYVRKPFDPDYLLRVCEGARRERALLRVEDLLEQRTRELRQSEALQRTLLHGLPAGMVIVDAATRIIEQVNDHVPLMHGAPVDHLIGQQCHALLCPADKGACPVCDLGQTLDNSEREMLKEDGTRLPILKTVKTIQINGRDKLLECFIDISRQKRIESELRKSENRYRRLINNLPDIVYIFSDLRGGVFWSPSVETVLGYSVEHMHANPFLWNESIHPEDKDKVTLAIIESSREKPFVVEYRIRDARGDWRWLHDRSTTQRKVHGETFIEGIATDITKRKLAEEELRNERLRLDNIIRGTNVGTWEWNVQTGETVFNERWAEIIGYTLGELTPVSIETWKKHTHPDDLKISMDLLERHFSGDLDYYECEARMKHKSGEWVFVLDRGRVFTWAEDGRPMLMYGTHLDITARKQAEQALMESEAKFRTLFNESPVSIIIHDKITGEILHGNAVAYRTYGLDSLEALQANEFWTDSPYSAHDALQWIHKGAAEGVQQFEWKNKKVNGDVFWEHVTLRPVVIDGDERVLSVAVDITDRKLAEEKIRTINAQLQKAIAEKDKLFTIIAHDLKSPMSGLLTSTEFLAHQPDSFSEKDLRLLATALHKSARNTFELLEDLLQWARMSQGGMDFAPTASSLKELADKSLAGAQAVAKSKEILIRSVVPHNVTVMADSHMINTVTRNILFNAIKFTHRGGEIVITAQQSEQNVTMAIQDNGMGMDEQTLATIFSLENKKRHLGTEGERGTGLGLMLCKQFIEQHGGKIWVQSEPGKGTTVFFSLPVA